MHFTEWPAPYQFILDSGPLFLLMAGPPLTLLAVPGLLRPKKRELAISLSVAVLAWAVMTGVLICWPWTSLFGYLYFCSVVGWYIMGAIGTLNLADLAAAGCRGIGL